MEQPKPNFINRLIFYFTYGLRNIQRGGRWTMLAVFCIAAGVATVVALRGLGLSVGESLISTVREDNKGDLLIQRETDDGPDFALLRGSGEVEFFDDDEIATLENYASENNIDLSFFTTGGAVQIAGQSDTGVSLTTQFIVSYLIDPPTYSNAVGGIRVLEPRGVEFDDLFTEGQPDIVVSENMATSLGLSVGDQVRVVRTETPFTVRGIVGAEAEAGISNIGAAFFGFAYFDIDTVRTFIDAETGFNRASLVYPRILELDEANREENTIYGELGFARRNYFISSAAESLEGREAISVALGDFIVTLGLGALLIGGVGILNTMLVLVRRRTSEIAALKTFGLKGRQIALLFLAEGILLGLLGSIIGCVAGVLLGGFVNQFGSQFLQQTVAWRIYPEALLYGFSLGMATTVIFGLAPIMTALQIRPAIVLRPNEGQVARLGILQSLGLMILITVLLGLIVGQIVQPTFGLSSSLTSQDAYLWSVIGVAVTFVILGLLVMILWVLVWIIGKFPAFGWVDLQLALRNLSAQRLRTSTTLLALTAGMFALSSITFVSEGTRQLLDDLVQQSFGGNVLAIPLQPTFDDSLIALAERSVNRALEDVDGVLSTTTIGFYDGDLEAIDGQRIDIDAVTDEFNPLDSSTTSPFAWQNFTVWTTDNDSLWNDTFNIVQGRPLSLRDVGQPTMIGSLEGAQALGIEIGSVVTYRVGRNTIDLTVVGLYDGGSLIGSAGAIIAPEILDGLLNPQFQLFTFEAETEAIPQVVTELSAIPVPPILALDVRIIDGVIGQFIAQFVAIPTIVGILSLLAAAVIMANTIALSTLERRRQIGVLKAIGLKSNRVLFVMLIEATIIGLLSAFLGIGLSQLGLFIFQEVTGAVIPLPREAVIVGVILVISAVLIAWLSTFLSANVAVRERVMNVLRYE